MALGHYARAGLTLAAPAVLLGCGPPAAPAADAPAALVAAAAYWLAWLLAGRLLLALALAALGRLPGPLGATALRLARRLAPAFLAAAVELLAGAAAPALAGTGTAPPPSLDWPVAAAPAPPPPPAPVRVRPGDCLWAIAARHLPPGSPAVDVARAWPAWYAANRAVIGPDPALIHPGQLLVPPEEDR